MNETELIALQKRVQALTFCNYGAGVLNVLLIIIPCWHYYTMGFRVPLDMYFVWVIVLNFFGFYLTYLVTSKLQYFKKKHYHFSEKLSGGELYE